MIQIRRIGGPGRGQGERYFDCSSAFDDDVRDPHNDNIEQLKFTCQQCGKAFASEVQAFSHRAKMHGYRSAWALRISTSHCPVCGMQFHTRGGILAHLRRYGAQNKCASAVLLMPAMSFEEVSSLESEALTVRRNAPRKQLQPPAIRVFNDCIAIDRRCEFE